MVSPSGISMETVATLRRMWLQCPGKRLEKRGCAVDTE